MPRFLPGLLAALALAGCDEAAPTLQPPPPCAVTSGEWEFLGLQAPDLATVGAVATSPHTPGLLLAATRADFSGGRPGRLFKSDDDGQTWALVYDGDTFGGGFTDVDFDFADPAVAYALPYGVIESTDGGQTWADADGGILLDFDTRARALVQDRGDPTGRTVLLGTISSLGGGSLYRSTDGAETWENLAAPSDQCQGPDPPGNCYFGGNGLYSLAASPSDPNVLYAGMNSVGFVLRSDDGEVVWELRGLLEAGLPRTLAVDRVDPDVAYAAATPPFNGGPSAYRSADGGRTWEPFTAGLPEPYGGGSVVQDPATGVLYFIGAQTGVSAEGALWSRRPGEAAWTEVATPVEGMAYYSALHFGEDGRLYVGGDGLWRVDPKTLTATEPGPCDP